MAVPIILAGAALASGGFGLSKLFGASNDKTTAMNMITDALNCAEFVLRDSNRQRERANNCLDALGRLKLVCSSELMGRFESNYKKVKNIDYKKLEFSGLNIKKEIFNIESIHTESVNASNLIKGGISTLSAGAVAGYGAYGLATTIGTASTGTAISTLSGVAASNATLAWLGGGSVASGGMGIAGGTTILGGVIAGPALLVMGLLAAKKSEENLTNAVRDEAKIRVGIEQIQNSIEVSKSIQKRKKI